MKINKKELIFMIVMGISASGFAFLSSVGIVLNKDIGLSVGFGAMSFLFTVALIFNFFVTNWYTKIEEISLSEFEEYLFKNKYILVHKVTRMAFDIPIVVMDMLDFTTIKIRNNYDYKKRFKDTELNLFDQKRVK